MFVEPDSAGANNVVKADPTASARSRIRRQRTVRYSPGTRLHQQASSSSSHRRQVAGNDLIRQPVDRRSLLEDVRREDQNDIHIASTQAVLNENLDLGLVLLNTNPSSSHTANITLAQTAQRSRADSGRAPLRDGLIYERPSQSIGANETYAMPGHPTSRSHVQPFSAAEVDAMRDLPLLSSWRSPPPRYVPTPPHTSGTPLDRSPPPLGQPVGSAAYTPGFAPAHQALGDQADGRLTARLTDLTILADQIRDCRMLPQFSEESALTSMLIDTNAMIGRSSSELSQDYLALETQHIYHIRHRLEEMSQRARGSREGQSLEDSDLADLAPLRPTRRRGAEGPRSTLRNARRDDLDGLGDRQRSFSPDAVSWETMLTTIPPDDRAPSTQSSFTSASATVPGTSLGSNSTSTSSNGTMVTVPSASSEAEPCPAVNVSSSDVDSPDEDVADAGMASRHERSTDFLTQANFHLDRIESLSRRLEHQRSGGEHVVHRRRIFQRETELQRIEANLLRLERQIEDERLNTPEWQRYNGVRAGRERL